MNRSKGGTTYDNSNKLFPQHVSYKVKYKSIFQDSRGLGILSLHHNGKSIEAQLSQTLKL